MPDKNWRPKISQIEDLIAEDHWEYVTPQGKRRTSRLLVGRPTHYPKARAWYCPIFIEGHTRRVDTVFGQGPVDALMNAMGVIRTFFEQNLSVVPGAKPRLASRKKSVAARRQQGKAIKKSSPLEKPLKAIRRKAMTP